MQTSMIRRDKKKKFAAMAGGFAMEIARRNGDPDYDKYKKYRKLYMDLKKKITTKYRTKAKQEVRKSISEKNKPKTDTGNK
jgi:hypothetical protein